MARIRLGHFACFVMLCLRANPVQGFIASPLLRTSLASRSVDITKRYMAAGGGKGKSKVKAITAYKLLQSQGFGSRKWCKSLIETGYLQVEGEEIRDPDAKLMPEEGLMYNIGDEEFQYRTKATILLNKPVGYECSQKPKENPTVYDLLPEIFQVRGMQPVGRLDVETSGALLFTDDGQLNHALCSPKRMKDKVYIATCKHELEDSIIETLLRGVELRDEPGVLVQVKAAEKISDTKLSITLTEGKYHQVRRMIAAAGNRCEGLHRKSFAGLEVGVRTRSQDIDEGDLLADGEWRWVEDDEVEEMLSTKSAQRSRPAEADLE